MMPYAIHGTTTLLLIKIPTSLAARSCPEQGIFRLSGSRAIFILVVRDKDISFQVRKGNCNDADLREQEEAFVVQILVDEIDMFLLDEKSDRQQNINNEGEHNNGRGKLNVVSNVATTTATLLPIWNNVLVVSYKSLMMLGNTCANMILNTLGINSDYVPNIHNGNYKHVARLNA